MNRNLKAGAAVVVAALLFAVGGVSTAVAAKLITGADIAANTITAANLAPGSVGKSELKAGIVKDGKPGKTGPAGATGPQGPIGPQGAPGDPASDVLGDLAASSTADPAVVTNIGGTFGTFTVGPVRATLLDTVTLPAGNYVLTANGFFHSTVAVSGLTRMQLALRIDDGTDWGVDVGTCFTDATSPLADREATCSTSRVVELAAPADVLVYAFGYADNQGSADSGKFAASSYVNAVKVG
jgi:hypothetical protein